MAFQTRYYNYHVSIFLPSADSNQSTKAQANSNDVTISPKSIIVAVNPIEKFKTHIKPEIPKVLEKNSKPKKYSHKKEKNDPGLGANKEPGTYTRKGSSTSDNDCIELSDLRKRYLATLEDLARAQNTIDWLRFGLGHFEDFDSEKIKTPVSIKKKKFS